MIFTNILVLAYTNISIEMPWHQDSCQGHQCQKDVSSMLSYFYTRCLSKWCHCSVRVGVLDHPFRLRCHPPSSCHPSRSTTSSAHCSRQSAITCTAWSSTIPCRGHLAPPWKRCLGPKSSKWCVGCVASVSVSECADPLISHWVCHHMNVLTVFVFTCSGDGMSCILALD